MPPDRQWVPGYWTQTGNNDYQWVSGYWGNAGANEVEYFPEPPATLEVGPNIEAVGPNQTWLPGSWVWHNGRYAWRPGYWTEVQPNWVWVPAHYVYAPGGYVFVDGYFDYPVDARGVLFAPIYFNQPVYSNAGFYYSPTTAINLAVFSNYLFLRPNYCHYYFGDYYAANYAGVGFYPWFSYHNHHGYDPIFAHQRWKHRDDRDWEQGLARDFDHRRDHKDARPPHTWHDERTLAGKGGPPRDFNARVGMPLDELAKNKDGGQRFVSIDKEARQKLGERQQDFQKFQRQRQELESKSSTAGNGSPSKRTLPKTPIAVHSGDQLGKDLALPERHKAPKPDANVNAKSRDRRDENRNPPGNRVAPRTGPKNTQFGDRKQDIGAVPSNRRGGSPSDSSAPALVPNTKVPPNLGAKAPDFQTPPSGRVAPRQPPVRSPFGAPGTPGEARPNRRVGQAGAETRGVPQPGATSAPQGGPKTAVEPSKPAQIVGPQGRPRGGNNQTPSNRNFGPESRTEAGPSRDIAPQPNRQFAQPRTQTTNRVPVQNQSPKPAGVPDATILRGNGRGPQNNAQPPAQNPASPRFNRPVAQPQQQNQVIPPPSQRQFNSSQAKPRVAPQANQPQPPPRVERRPPPQPRNPEPNKGPLKEAKPG